MHIPYSMDDSEPDLYGGLGGHHDDTEDLKAKYWPNVRMEYVECPKFYTQADIDNLIQKHLHVIDGMREEIMSAYQDGYDVGYDTGFTDGGGHGYDE